VLATISVPTLVLHGPTQRDEMLDVTRRVPDARSVALPDDTLMETFTSVVRETKAFVEGAEPDRIPDSVLATVLFTDLVGSTERAAALGDRAWGELLTRHYEDVRRALTRFRGEEIDSAGDGFFCRFDGPARAIACARAMVSSATQLDLDVRAGVHTGECEVVGEKLAGISVVTGARIAALAAPGEVLVSQTVKDLVAGSGFDLIDRGDHELKGVPGTWRVYAVAEGSRPG
jgi:class 3 adenylate cyclase